MFISLPPRHILKIPMNAEIKTSRLWDSTPTQVTLGLLPEILHSIPEESFRGLSFWGFLCCFCICCHNGLRDSLTLPSSFCDSHSDFTKSAALFFFLFFISRERVQNINITPTYWCISSHWTPPLCEWDILCFSMAVFHDCRLRCSLLGPDDVEDVKSRMTIPLF